jgi:hypothetical protein
MTRESLKGVRSAERTSPRMEWTAVWVGLATLADYLSWLGWDQMKYPGSDGYLHGPYEPWQVVGAVLVLGVIAAMAGWRRRAWVAVVMTTLVMTGCFSVTAVTGSTDDGLWLIGAFMVAVGTFLGVGLVALVAEAVTRARERNPDLQL